MVGNKSYRNMEARMAALFKATLIYKQGQYLNKCNFLKVGRLV